MKTTSEIHWPDDIKATLTTTATVEEWECLAATLTDQDGVQKLFREAIETVVSGAKRYTSESFPADVAVEVRL